MNADNGFSGFEGRNLQTVLRNNVEEIWSVAVTHKTIKRNEIKALRHPKQ
jgi:hypothetical protein